MDESTDIIDTAQLLVFVRAVDENFLVTQEMAGLVSLQGRITGRDIFDGLRSVLNGLNSQ